MKKSIFISGIVAANFMLVGCMCKVMHWPGANILITLAVFLLIFFFLPGALVSAYKSQEVKKHKLLYIVTYLVFSVTMLGTLFKIMHWPGASMFLLVGIPLPFILFLPVYLFETRKDKLPQDGASARNSTLNSIGIMFGLTFLAVFSVLLALNVSKNIMTSASHTMQKNDEIAFTASGKNKQAEKNINDAANDLNNYIEDLKCQLLMASENAGLCSNNKTIENLNPAGINQKDNAEISRFILINKGDKLSELKNKVEAYKNTLTASTKINPELKELCNTLFDVSDKESLTDDEVLSWEQRQFPSFQLIVVLNGLSQIQANVKLTESELLASN